MKRKVRAVLPQVLLIIIGPRLYFQSVFLLQFATTAITNFGVLFIRTGRLPIGRRSAKSGESESDFSTIDFAKDS